MGVSRYTRPLVELRGKLTTDKSQTANLLSLCLGQEIGEKALQRISLCVGGLLCSQGPGLGILARSAWLRRGNTLSLITEMSTIPLFCKLTTDKSQTANCILMQILGTANSTQPPATVCPSQKYGVLGGPRVPPNSAGNVGAD